MRFLSQIAALRKRKSLLKAVQREFDASFYLSTYADVKLARVDPFKHFMKFGWKESRNPRRDFNTAAYLRHNEDVADSGMNPFQHYVVYGRAEGRSAHSDEPIKQAGHAEANYSISLAPHHMQNRTFPLDAEAAERVMVIVIPEHNEMSGGIYSFFSIAKAAYALRHKHDYRVLLMTRPNKQNGTYLRQRNFRNSEDVFRFEQIVRCRAAKTVYLHIPEYAASSFVDLLEPHVLHYLKSRERLYINILNQKIDIMPDRDDIEELRTLAHELTQSVAHHAYFGQAFADRYGLPMLLLPPYTDLKDYEPIPFEEKRKLIIYSPDDADYRQVVLDALVKGVPDYELREIRGITFEKYMDLATQCRFSITFGEGFDGYLAQPIMQNGVGFAVYNDEFFPSKALAKYDNIFESGDDMASSIVDRIRALDSDPHFYRQTNRAMVEVYESLYSREDYMRRIEMLIHRKFEIYPFNLHVNDTRGARPVGIPSRESLGDTAFGKTRTIDRPS